MLQLDDQIYSNFYDFLNQVQLMEQSLSRNDYLGASAAYGRAQVIAERITSLFDQRKKALARI